MHKRLLYQKLNPEYHFTSLVKSTCIKDYSNFYSKITKEELVNYSKLIFFQFQLKEKYLVEKFLQIN